MTLDELVATGWEQHAADPAGVLVRLDAGIPLVTQRAHLAPFAGLVVHVAGEHLGRWADGLALLARLKRRPVFEAATPEGQAVARGEAALCYGAGDPAGFERALRAARTGGDLPEASDRARVLATAASALAGQRRVPEAAEALEQALVLTSYGPKADDPAARALAVTGNNLAVELESRAVRSPGEDALMVRAAQVGLTYWTLAGGWEQQQGAHYRLSSSLRRAGRPREALEQARRCQALVRAHGSPPTELFFAHEALAQALVADGDRPAARLERGAAAALLPRIDDPDARASAQSDLDALDAALAG